MGALEIGTVVAGTITQLAQLFLQAKAAEDAGDQATLDALKDRVVVASNALAPPGAEVVPVS